MPPKKIVRPVLAFRIPAPLYERLQKAAERSGKSISAECERRLEQSFERRAK
jgi:predicted HicB family RNase H-like nuclease